MPVDGRLFLLTILAITATIMLIVVQATWVVLTFALRRRGRRVTFLNHNWRKMQEEVASIQSAEEREKFERWSHGLRYTYAVWVATMILFALLAFSVYRD
jgi:hypothetical protein